MVCSVLKTSGALPPITRRRQATLFNQGHDGDGDADGNSANPDTFDTESDDEWEGVGNKHKNNRKKKKKEDTAGKSRRFDVLVATDAIAMGLNLSIRRIIFSTMEKFDGVSSRMLTPAVCMTHASYVYVLIIMYRFL